MVDGGTNTGDDVSFPIESVVVIIIVFPGTNNVVISVVVVIGLSLGIDAAGVTNSFCTNTEVIGSL